MADAFLDAGQIRERTLVRHAEVHDELDSTNTRAIELARDPGVELPALIVARCQTAGRGRGQHTWWSAEGALTFSVLLEPATLGISTVNWPQLSLATAVAVCDALAGELPTTGVRPSLGIKWPNDVLLDGAKLCGILIESPGGSAPAKDRMVIGIGINVNNSCRLAPPEVGQKGVALCDSTLRQHDVGVLLISFLQAFHERLDQLAANATELPAAWQQLCWLTDQHVEIQTNGQSIAGICAGIGRDGALLVKGPLDIQRVFSGTVRAKRQR